MSEIAANGKPTNRLTWMRRLTQLVALIPLGQWSFYGIFRCPFPVPFVDCQVCPIITCWGRLTALFWGFWLFLPLSVLLFGRSFCGWLCPGGLVNQLIGKISVAKLRIRNRFTRIAFWSGLAGLVIALILWLVLDNPRWMVPIRTGEFWNSVRLSFRHATGYWLARTLVVLGLVMLGLLVSNLWCRFACPAGSLLELVKRISLFKVYKTKACNDCDACLAVCEMGSRPSEVNCTNCADCLRSCPVDAIKIGRKHG